jgi:hypothetical protein
MHLASRPLTGAEGRRRIEVINYHADGLTEAGSGAEGLRFSARPDGSGVYCAPGAAGRNDALSKLCAGWREPAAIDRDSRRSLVRACRYMRKKAVMAAKGRGTRRTALPKKKTGLPKFAEAAFRSEN